MLVGDLRHFLELPDEAPGPARRLAEQLGALVRVATAGDRGPLGQCAAVPRSPVHHLRIPDEVATTLWELTLLDTDCERAVFRAYVSGDEIVLPVSDDDLEELIGDVDIADNHEPNRRRRQCLGTAFTVLDAAAENPHRSPLTTVASGGGSDEVPARPTPAASRRAT